MSICAIQEDYLRYLMVDLSFHEQSVLPKSKHPCKPPVLMPSQTHVARRVQKGIVHREIR
jgi:hypothetical protein